MKSLPNNKAIIMLCMAVSVGRFALDSYLPSLSAIATTFNASYAQVELTFTFYVLGFGLSQFVYGPLSDRYGRKLVLLIGLAIVTVSLMLCAIANSLPYLIFARFLSGIGAGANSVISRAVLADLYSESDFLKAWSKITTTVIISLLVAPVIGGYIEVYFGWRYNFLLSILYALIIFIIIKLFLPETNKNLNPSALKIRVIFTSYAKLFTHYHFMGYVICSTLAYVGLTAFFQMSSSIFIDSLGLSPIHYGWLVFCVAVSYLFGGICAKRLALLMSMEKVLLVAVMVGIIAGTALLVIYYLHEITVLTLMIAIVVYFIVARIIIPHALVGSLSLNPTSIGYAAAVSGGVQMIGSSLITSLIAMLPYDRQLKLAVTFIITSVLILILLYTLRDKEVSS